MGTGKKLFDECVHEDFVFMLKEVFGKTKFYIHKYEKDYFIMFKPEEENSPIETIIMFPAKDGNVRMCYLKPNMEKISVFSNGIIPESLTQKFFIE